MFERLCCQSVLAIVVVIAASGHALAGPVFDLISPPVGVGGAPDGPEANFTLTSDQSMATTRSMTLNNTLGSFVTPLPALPRFNEMLVDSVGLDTASAAGDISYFQNTGPSGYAVASDPPVMGVGQTKRGGDFVGASELDVDFDLKFDVNSSGWNGPLFVYQLFVLQYNLAAPGDIASFNADFTYTIDDGLNPPIVKELNILDTVTYEEVNSGAKSAMRVLFDFDLLATSPMLPGTLYRIEGDINYSSTDDEHAAVRLSQKSTEDNFNFDKSIVEKFNFYGLPRSLWNHHGGGAFVGNREAVPEPGSVSILLGMVTALLVNRRRR